MVVVVIGVVATVVNMVLNIWTRVELELKKRQERKANETKPQ